MLARMLGTHAMSRTSTAMKVEAAAILTGAGLVTIAAFTQAHFPLTFLPCIAVVAAAYRLGPFGAAAGMLIVTIITSLMTGQGYGPIAANAEAAKVKVPFLQLYQIGRAPWRVRVVEYM